MSPTRETGELFGRGAAGYARFRPSYPRKLFAYLAGLAPARRRAWDCATGNGQAAAGLAEFFAEVIATDASAEQIAHADPRPNVRYAAASADTLEAEPGSVDLVTVAQALHWLDLPPFYDEVRRVAARGGIIAAWCYFDVQIGDRVDPVLERFMLETMAPYWPAGRELVEQRYATIAFPFSEIEPPEFTMRVVWSLRELLGYVGTWSAVQRCREATGVDPVADLKQALANRWGEPEARREVRWPVHLRVGYVAAP